MADQCIVCLEILDSLISGEDPHIQSDSALEADDVATATIAGDPSDFDNQQPISVIKPCDHILHDECLREWSQKANSCPICRQSFNLVEVYNKVGGKSIERFPFPCIT